MFRIVIQEYILVKFLCFLNVVFSIRQITFYLFLFQKLFKGESKEIISEIQRVLISTEKIWPRTVRVLLRQDITIKDTSKKDTSKKDTSKKQDPIKAEMMEWRSRMIECWNYFKALLLFSKDSDIKSNYILTNLLRFCSARHLTTEKIVQMSTSKKPIETFQYSRIDPEYFYSEDFPILAHMMANLVESLSSTMDVAIKSLQLGHFDRSRLSYIKTALELQRTIKFGEMESGCKDQLSEMVDILKGLDKNWQSLVAVLKSHPSKGFFNFKSNKDILSSILMPEYYMGWFLIRNMTLQKRPSFDDSITLFTYLKSMALHIQMVASFAASFEKEKVVDNKGCYWDGLYISKCERPESWDSEQADAYLEAVCQITFASMKEKESKLYLERKIAEHFIQNRKKYSTLKSQKKVCFGANVSPNSFKQLTNDEVEYIDDNNKWMSSLPTDH